MHNYEEYQQFEDNPVILDGSITIRNTEKEILDSKRVFVKVRLEDSDFENLRGKYRTLYSGLYINKEWLKLRNHEGRQKLIEIYPSAMLMEYSYDSPVGKPESLKQEAYDKLLEILSEYYLVSPINIKQDGEVALTGVTLNKQRETQHNTFLAKNFRILSIWTNGLVLDLESLANLKDELVTSNNLLTRIMRKYYPSTSPTSVHLGALLTQVRAFFNEQSRNYTWHRTSYASVLDWMVNVVAEEMVMLADEVTE